MRAATAPTLASPAARRARRAPILTMMLLASVISDRSSPTEVTLGTWIDHHPTSPDLVGPPHGGVRRGGVSSETRGRLSIVYGRTR